MAIKGAGESGASDRRRIIYRAVLSARWGVSSGRESSKVAPIGERTVLGSRDSEVMVARSPNWVGVETRVWKALRRSAEAVGRFG